MAISKTRETEVLMSTAGVQSPRLKPVEIGIAGGKRLVTQNRSLSSVGIAWAEIPQMDLAVDEVEITVVATGLNYRDVMWSRGLLPAEALGGGFLGPCLGMECSGHVRRAGSSSGRYRGRK